MESDYSLIHEDNPDLLHHKGLNQSWSGAATLTESKCRLIHDSSIHLYYYVQTKLKDFQ